MPEVNSVNSADYNPYQTQPIQTQDHYLANNNMPPVYDPDIDAKKKSASSGLGLKLLGYALLGTVLVAGGYKWGKSSVNNEAEKFKEIAKELDSEANKVVDECFGGFRNGKDFARKTKELLKEYVPEVEEAVDGVAKEAKEAAKAAEEAAV